MDLIAIIAAIVVLIVLGMLWYGPLFGKTWMPLIGLNPAEAMQRMKQGMTWRYAVQVVAAFFVVFVLGRAIMLGGASEGITGAAAAFHFAFWNWLGFVAPVTLGMVLWENKPWKYWFIVAGYWLVALILAGLVLAYW